MGIVPMLLYSSVPSLVPGTLECYMEQAGFVGRVMDLFGKDKVVLGMAFG